MSLRIRCLAIGRSRDRDLAALIGRYTARCAWPIEFIELDLRRPVAPAARPAAEAELLLSHVVADEGVIALDEIGQDLTSVEFAHRLGAWRDEGRRQVACLIGGADGHGAQVRARADLQLALGRMTWPHEMVRLLLAEQLYRASAILAGHPYHRA